MAEQYDRKASAASSWSSFGEVAWWAVYEQYVLFGTRTVLVFGLDVGLDLDLMLDDDGDRDDDACMVLVDMLVDHVFISNSTSICNYWSLLIMIICIFFSEILVLGGLLGT